MEAGTWGRPGLFRRQARAALSGHDDTWRGPARLGVFFSYEFLLLPSRFDDRGLRRLLAGCASWHLACGGRKGKRQTRCENHAVSSPQARKKSDTEQKWGAGRATALVADPRVSSSIKQISHGSVLGLPLTMPISSLSSQDRRPPLEFPRADNLRDQVAVRFSLLSLFPRPAPSDDLRQKPCSRNRHLSAGHGRPMDASATPPCRAPRPRRPRNKSDETDDDERADAC
jgi:hypothetical protein